MSPRSPYSYASSVTVGTSLKLCGSGGLWVCHSTPVAFQAFPLVLVPNFSDHSR